MITVTYWIVVFIFCTEQGCRLSPQHSEETYASRADCQAHIAALKSAFDAARMIGSETVCIEVTTERGRGW